VNELSQEAFFDLTYSAISLGDSLFEPWLPVTFAAIDRRVAWQGAGPGRSTVRLPAT